MSDISDGISSAEDSGSPEVAQPAAGQSESELLTLGWREWVALPDLGLTAIKAKIDTGARTSALHAFDIVEQTDADGSLLVSFKTQPVQRNEALVIECRAPVVGKRQVTDSGGHTAERYVVLTTLTIGGAARRIELTLTDRRGMLFRMLVGRTSLVPGVAVDPGGSFLMGRQSWRDHYIDAQKSGRDNE